MDVFISWSGDLGFKVATVLKDWLPMVIQSIVPWISSEDIKKGARWMTELGKQLEKLKLGVICVTPENMQAPWLLFEAGALSKVLDTSLVCPFLFGLEPADLQGPLAQFQSTRSTKEDVRKLLSTINGCTETPLADPQVEKLFTLLWPELEKKLDSIKSDVPDQVSHARSVPDLLSEVLDRVRSIERQLAVGIAHDDLTMKDSMKKIQKILNHSLSNNYDYLQNRLMEANMDLSTLYKMRAELANKIKNASGAEKDDLEARLKDLKRRALAAEAIVDWIRVEKDKIEDRLVGWSRSSVGYTSS